MTASRCAGRSGRSTPAQASTRTSFDTVHFNIPAASAPGCVAATGVCTIAVSAGGLPTISRTVTIDGYTQPGASPNTLTVGNNAALKIELNGAGAGTDVSGLVIDAANTTARGLLIRTLHSFEKTVSAIRIQQAGSGATITGSQLGQGFTGWSYAGVTVVDAPHVTIGGTTPGARNVAIGIAVSGAGAGDALIQGNYVGTNVAG